MNQELDRLWNALQSVSDGKFAAHEIRESALDALSDWGWDRYQWVYALLPLQTETDKNQDLAKGQLLPAVPPDIRTRLKNIVIGLEAYIPNGDIPYPISDLSDIEKNGAMANY